MEKSIEDHNINPEKYAKPERYDVGSYPKSTRGCVVSVIVQYFQ